MGGLQEAVYNGETLGFRALVDANQFWAFNGVVGMTDMPLMNVARGETARVKMRNETAFSTCDASAWNALSGSSGKRRSGAAQGYVTGIPRRNA